MTIQDLSGNPFVTESGLMLGFTPIPATADALNLSMYRFIVDVIRQEDQANGDRFIERYLQGPQALWNVNVTTALNVRQLWDVAAIPDRYLQFLKNIVGWTDEFSDFTDRLSDAQLRRLIASSVLFWKLRGPEDAIEAILESVLGVRLRIWNWFDLRFILGETQTGEDWKGYDPHMISEVDSSAYEIRIVDNGTLDRQIVIDLVDLTRPLGQTASIFYIGFLDQFSVDGDTSQWTEEGVTSPTVTGGTMVLDQASTFEEMFVSVPGSIAWTNYVYTMRVRGRNHSIVLYRTGNTDFYEVLFDTDDNSVKLRKSVAGVFTTLDDFDFDTFPLILDPDIYQAIRVSVSPEAGSTRCTVFFDGELILTALDGAHLLGTIAISKQAGATDTVELDEVELYFNPLESDVLP